MFFKTTVLRLYFTYGGNWNGNSNNVGSNGNGVPPPDFLRLRVSSGLFVFKFWVTIVPSYAIIKFFGELVAIVVSKMSVVRTDTR